MAVPSPCKVSLKLVIDKKARKVLYADAGKETVDFLCSILTLPVGTVIKLLSKQGRVGCLSNLYHSIESLNDDYIQPNEHKDTVLNPMATSTSFLSNSLVHQFLTYALQKVKKFYRCASGHIFVTDKFGTPCPSSSCKSPMIYEVTVVNGNDAGEVAGGGRGGGGFVKGVVRYMVTDDLAVFPMSTTTLINGLKGSDVRDLEEKVVDLDFDKALKLLEISLQSKNVLTTVFLELKPVGDHTSEVETAVEGASTGGFVKGVVMYILMDDHLSVKPMSTISSIALLKKLNVKDVKALQERVVHLDIDKGLKLLKTAFQSKEVLTSVFILQDEVPSGTCKK